MILEIDFSPRGRESFPRGGGGKLKKGVKKYMPNIAKYSEQTFDDIRHINENGQEFGMPASFNTYWSIQNGATSARQLTER